MNPTISVTQTIDRSAAIKQAFKALDGHRVLVGIPEDKSQRQADADGTMPPIGNAAIGYIQEHGSPANNIPGRAFLEPGLQKIVGDVVDLLRDSARQALAGNPGGVMTNFNKIGLLAVNSVRAMFVDNDWAPLKPATLAARARIGGKPPKRRKGQPAPMPKRANPLINTSQLRKAITYVIRGRS